MKEVFEYLEEMKSRGDEKAKELLLSYAFYEQHRSASDDDEDSQDKTFIVVASFLKKGQLYEKDLIDEWSAHSEIKRAQKAYNNHLKRDDLYSASICKVIVSTDYE